MLTIFCDSWYPGRQTLSMNTGCWQVLQQVVVFQHLLALQTHQQKSNIFYQWQTTAISDPSSVNFPNKTSPTFPECKYLPWFSLSGLSKPSVLHPGQVFYGRTGRFEAIDCPSLVTGIKDIALPGIEVWMDWEKVHSSHTSAIGDFRGDDSADILLPSMDQLLGLKMLWKLFQCQTPTQ